MKSLVGVEIPERFHFLLRDAKISAELVQANKLGMVKKRLKISRDQQP